MIVDFIDQPDQAAFRSEVRRFIAEAVEDLPSLDSHDWGARLEHFRVWQRMVHEAGYAGLAWPTEYGGQEATVHKQAIWVEELNRAAGVPEPLNGVGEKLAGPTIIEFGTVHQKERFLRPILTGEELWCQLFSEPDAGSDLASLQTKATRTDGGWRVSGSKVWTSRAQIADHAILLARTGGGPRHAGITYFLLPMRQEGVTVSPLRQMTGDVEFNEVVIDDVVVPDDLVVGDVDGGWRVALATLQYERAFVALGRVDFGRWFEDLVVDTRAALATAEGESTGGQMRQRVARLYERTLVQRVTGQRVLARVDRGEAPGAESSVGKLALSPLLFDLAEAGLELAGMEGQLDPLGSGDERGSVWQRRAQIARGMAIAGGTPQIQKNIVAEQVLGLPRQKRELA